MAVEIGCVANEGPASHRKKCNRGAGCDTGTRLQTELIAKNDFSACRYPASRQWERSDVLRRRCLRRIHRFAAAFREQEAWR